MDYDIKCEKCHQKMYQMPDHADDKTEDSSAQTDEKIRFQCLNKNCDVEVVEIGKTELEEMGEYNW